MQFDKLGYPIVISVIKKCIDYNNIIVFNIIILTMVCMELFSYQDGGVSVVTVRLLMHAIHDVYNYDRRLFLTWSYTPQTNKHNKQIYI